MVIDRDKLSHHEALRYDYLYKNIHYLNDNEKREFAFLAQKAQGKLGSAPAPSGIKQLFRRQKHQTVGQEVPAQRKKARQQAREVAAAQTTAASGYLPKYQPSRTQAKRRQKNKRSKMAHDVERTTQKMKSQRQREQRQTLRRAYREKHRWRWKKAVKWLFLSFLFLIVALFAFFFKGVYDAKQMIDQRAGQAEVFYGQDSPDGTNILIMGTDVRSGEAHGSDGDSRTDSIMVMNVGNRDGNIKLVSFMRDTLINIPGHSEEDDFGTIYYDYKLNASYALGEQAGHQGAEYVRQALKHNFDIDIKYYAMVDFASFVKTVDQLFPEGVEVDAQFATVGGEVVSEVQVPNDTGLGTEGLYYPIKVGPQRMSGETLLNYARYRSDDEYDAGRVKRQRQVIQAVLFQTLQKPWRLLYAAETLGELYGASTNLPFSFLLGNGGNIISGVRRDFVSASIPEYEDWEEDYDKNKGLGLFIDFEKYKMRLAELGLR